MHVVSWLAAVAGLVIMTTNGAGKKLLFIAFCVGMIMAAKVDPTSSLIVWHLIVGCWYIWIWNMVHQERSMLLKLLLLLIFQLGQPVEKMGVNR